MKRTDKYIWMCSLLSILLLAACSDEDGNGKVKAKIQEIAVKTNVAGMLTRTTTIDNSTALQDYDIKIDAYFHDTETAYLSSEKLHYTGGDPSWSFWDGSAALHYYWPIAGSVYEPAGANITFSSLDFVGFCPYDKPLYIGTPTYNHSTGVTFTATLPTTEVEDVDYMTLTNQASLQEYLVAVLDGQTYATQDAAGGALPLQFKHPFALIKFVITAESGTHVQINSISIEGLKTTGTCAYDGTTMTWSSLSGSATMKLEQVLKVGETTETTPFMVIPNTYGSKYLTVNATWDDWSNTVTISDYGKNVDFNWEAGHIYTYNLTLDKYGLKVDAAKYTEQW